MRNRVTLNTGFTVHIKWADGREEIHTVSTSGLAQSIADHAWDTRNPVLVEVTDNIQGYTRGRSKPVSVPSPEPVDDYNREYAIAPWAFEGDCYD